MLNTKKIISQSGVHFGTSGARGLVTQFTPEVCSAFTHAFLQSLSGRFDFRRVAVAIDNRPSSPDIAEVCIGVIESYDLEAVYYGVIPTPALAYSAMQEGIPCIMITGSHIPFDRNGMKFYRPDGEITKHDEELIVNTEFFINKENKPEKLIVNSKAKEAYIERYTQVFDSDFLHGMRIGIYEHSSAGRDIYPLLFSKLGAEVISIERSDKFVPIDTEAVSKKDIINAQIWSKKYNLDVIFSTDGDGDRPLVADEYGNFLRGDILGLLAAQHLQVEALAVPINCNSIIDSIGDFKQVIRTKIGSPFVISEFSNFSKRYATFAGFEANGGFLLGSDVTVNNKLLKALPTRDAVLPVLLLLGKSKSTSIFDLVLSLPKRYTSSDRIQNYSLERSKNLLELISEKPSILLDILGFHSLNILHVDTTDGIRVTLDSGDILHLRRSGNAPELRCYAESDSMEKTSEMVTEVLNKLKVFTSFNNYINQ